MAPEAKGMLKAGVVLLLNVSVGWPVVAGAEVLRLLPKPPKPVLLLDSCPWGQPTWGTEPLGPGTCSPAS